MNKRWGVLENKRGTRGRRRLWAGETRSRGRPRVGGDQGAGETRGRGRPGIGRD